ncbi:hypothetical protein Rt10032_c18g6026 [Rhodotorula toruloides]|uniref:Uncharacterized protein n=1 Tax=Rhodotorula toruloides TaxID=5286 RepID=A0A511KNR6_RHOTO|nr:hypothetical protein Rt10032_c18g6026 [Rhodotorula toruloides]
MDATSTTATATGTTSAHYKVDLTRQLGSGAGGDVWTDTSGTLAIKLVMPRANEDLDLYDVRFEEGGSFEHVDDEGNVWLAMVMERIVAGPARTLRPLKYLTKHEGVDSFRGTKPHGTVRIPALVIHCITALKMMGTLVAPDLLPSSVTSARE